jgi:hypothetical protein
VRPQLPALAALILVTTLVASPATAAPTCPDPLTRPACGGRVVAEPEQSTTFHQFEGPVENAGASLKAIEARSPGFLEVKTLAEWTGHPEDKSYGGRPLWVVRVTDERIPQANKRQAVASVSVHATEPVGREGAFRYLEDLAQWTAALPATDHALYSGDVAKPVSQVMAQTEFWVGFTNSDGWAAGDAGKGTFVRENGHAQDLNRDFATVGWYDRVTGSRGVAESEPETKGWTRLVRSLPHVTTSTDIHGELTTPNDAFADLIIPAGQWTPKRQEQVDQLSKHMIGTIDRKFAEEGVVLADLLGPVPADGNTPRRAANVAASYDIVGYDDSGFMGDWFSQRADSVHMDVENFLSHLVPGIAWQGTLEQAHVAAARGILESVLVESMVTDAVTPELHMQRVAYVDDAFRTSSDAAVPDGVPGTGFALAAGETQVPYDVSRLEYFKVLERTIGRPVDAVSVDEIAAGADLSDYDSLVLADLPNGLPLAAAAAPPGYVQALKAYAQAGGQLVLTDRSLQLLDELGVLPGSQTVNKTDAGHVDFLQPLGDHPYEAGLVGAPSQTWYEVMLGYPSRGQAPNYGVTRTAWEAAGGTTVATVGNQGASTSPNTALGYVPAGKGRITIFGSILPQAIEKLGTTTTPHPFGLADYAVTITGGQVLDNVLAYARERSDPVVPEVPTTALLPILASLLLGALVVRQRRARLI